MPFTIENIELDQYTVEVEVTSLVNEPAYPTCRDSADDFYGYREVEFSVIHAVEYDEDGNMTARAFSESELVGICQQHQQTIEEHIWALVDAGEEQ